MPTSVPKPAAQQNSTGLPCGEPSQLAVPVAVSPEEVARQKSLGAALSLCAHLAGYDLDKELQLLLGVDKAQFSRWHSGTEGILWPKLERLMDACGNDVPILWMLYQRGYDLHAIRKRESETQRENRELKDQLAKERMERAAIEAAMRRIVTGSAT